MKQERYIIYSNNGDSKFNTLRIVGEEKDIQEQVLELRKTYDNVEVTVRVSAHGLSDQVYCADMLKNELYKACTMDPSVVNRTADMFWDDDNPEDSCCDDPSYIVEDNFDDGDTVTLQAALRLPNFSVTVVGNDYELRQAEELS